MKYKLIAVDIDGTLLDSNSRLREDTIRSVRRGVSKGLIFTISTGRPVQGIRKLLKELDIKSTSITYNGSMIVSEKEEILYSCTLKPADAVDIIRLGMERNLSVIFWAKNILYANGINKTTIAYSEISGVPPVAFHDYQSIASEGITKVIWIDTPEEINRHEKEVGAYLSDHVNYHTSRPMFLEFVDKSASKALAMQKLGEIYGISREEMIAVGDGLNDYSMIEYAGLGVAMANSHPEILKIADYVTRSNDENGVGYVIDQLIND
ncbi:MAG TPA: Cof-type HAD-IIB family hydrolase [Clostridiales bacterium]|nr:Cof-type HAD-IIB family hydrolase [Clostridiales bacterium]